MPFPVRVRRENQPPPPEAVPSPEGAGQGAVARADVLDALRRLPARQADVLTLRYFLDLTEADVADTLGMERGTVKSHAHRGLERLSVLLKDAP